VSLNGGHKPFEYETAMDADMDRIKHAKHVDATDAEVAALEKLRAGEQVILTGDSDRRYLLGAIRATADCTKCHGVREGTLLGAFRYPLVAVAIAQNAKGAATDLPLLQRAQR